MKILTLFFTLSVLAALAAAPVPDSRHTAESSLPTRQEMRLAEHWFEAITTGKTHRDSWLGTKLPFSFRIGGRESSEILPTWKLTRSRSTQGKTDHHKLTWQDEKSGLRVIWQLRRFLDYPSVEWSFWFENTGSQPVKIEDVQSLALRLSGSDRGGPFVLHGLNGGRKGTDDMMPLRKELRGLEAESIVLGGDPFPSNLHLPFFNIEGTSGRGVLVGVGAPHGWWEARFRERDSQLDVAVKDQSFTIAPGQKARGQRILLVLWEGRRLGSGGGQSVGLTPLRRMARRCACRDSHASSSKERSTTF